MRAALGAELVLATFTLAGCAKDEPIIPCQSKIDTVDFNSSQEMLKFVQKAIPLNSDLKCFLAVTSGTKMINSGPPQLQPNGDFLMDAREAHPGYRWFYWISVGYDNRRVYAIFRKDKIIEIGVN
jgi:hypothetical protein